MTKALILLLRAYQRFLSPILHAIAGPGAGCRFSPTCSQYAIEALRVHGLLKGCLLTMKRLLRCQPWGGCGHDPVPPPKSTDKNGVSSSS